jgi:hypothetical protein
MNLGGREGVEVVERQRSPSPLLRCPVFPRSCPARTAPSPAYVNLPIGISDSAEHHEQVPCSDCSAVYLFLPSASRLPSLSHISPHPSLHFVLTKHDLDMLSMSSESTDILGRPLFAGDSAEAAPA